MAQDKRTTKTHISLTEGLKRIDSPTSPKHRGFVRKRSENRGSVTINNIKDQLRSSPQRGLARKNSSSPQRGVNRNNSGDRHSALKESLKQSPQRGLTRSGSGNDSPVRGVSRKNSNSPQRAGQRVGSGSPGAHTPERGLSRRPSMSRARSSFIENPETKSHGFLVRVNSESNAATAITPSRGNSFKDKEKIDGQNNEEEKEEEEEEELKELPKKQQQVMDEVVSSITSGLGEVASHNVDIISDALLLCESVIRSFTKRGLRRRSSTTERKTSVMAISRASLMAKPLAEISELVCPMVIRLLHDIKAFPRVLLEGCYPVPALPLSEARTVIVFPKGSSAGRSHNIHAKAEPHVPKPKKGTVEFMKLEAQQEATNALHNYGIPEHRNSPISVFNDLRTALKTGHWSLIERLVKRLQMWLEQLKKMAIDCNLSSAEHVAELSARAFLSDLIDIRIPPPKEGASPSTSINSQRFDKITEEENDLASPRFLASQKADSVHTPQHRTISSLKNSLRIVEIDRGASPMKKSTTLMSPSSSTSKHDHKEDFGGDEEEASSSSATSPPPVYGHHIPKNGPLSPIEDLPETPSSTSSSRTGRPRRFSFTRESPRQQQEIPPAIIEDGNDPEVEKQKLREARRTFLRSKSKSNAMRMQARLSGPLSLGIVFEYDPKIKCCFVRNFLPLKKDAINPNDDKLTFFRAEVRMLEDRKVATASKATSADMGDVGCLKGRVHRGAVLVSIDNEILLGKSYEYIHEEIIYASSDEEAHRVRFCHAPVQWLMKTPIPDMLPLPPLPPEDVGTVYSLAAISDQAETDTNIVNPNTAKQDVSSTSSFADNQSMIQLMNERKESEKKLLRTQQQKRRVVKPVTSTAVVPRRVNKFQQLREAGLREKRGFSMDRTPEPPIYSHPPPSTHI